MDTLKIWPALLLLACERDAPPAPLALLSAEACMCPCACDAPAADAAADAQPDATEPPDLTTEWTRTVITAGTATLRGADGVARDEDGCWTTAWEESGKVTRACPVDGAWQTEIVASGLSAPEDAKAGDLDADGALDVAIAAGSAVRIAFRGAPLLVTLSASAGHGGPMQVAIADINADAHLDVVMGTRMVGAVQGAIGWLENPGPPLARDGAAWTYHPIGPAGWTMSLVAIDWNIDSRMDVLVTDRAKVGTADWSLYGARWMEQLGDGTWSAHAISLPAGSCSPYTAPSCAKTPGDAMMAGLDGRDVLLGSSSGSQVDSRLVLYAADGTRTVLPPAVDVGHYQHSVMYDVDGDGDRDVVVSTWKGNALPLAPADAARSGVYWLRAPNWDRGEVWRDAAKLDNLERMPGTRCVVTSEQLNNTGVVMLCPPLGAP